MIISCLGMQSSASTWVYNVVREILKAANIGHAAFLGETFGDLVKADTFGHRTAVIKAHRFEGGLTKVIQLAGNKLIVSVRDPRDATASLVQRFGADIHSCAAAINRSLATIYSIVALADHITFYYDDYFSESVENVAKLCAYLDISLSASEIRDIFERYRAESVRSFIATIDSLPSDQKISESDSDVADRDTQFHRNHMTDMKTGKWSSVFSGDDKRSLDALFRAYAGLIERRGLGSSDVSSNFIGDGALSLEFDSRLFCPVDDINRYTRRLAPAECFSDFGFKLLDYIYLPFGHWILELKVEAQGKPMQIVACQRGEIIGSSQGRDTLSFEFKNHLSTHPFIFHVTTECMPNNTECPPTARLFARRLA
jgi:hypothetical protein